MSFMSKEIELYVPIQSNIRSHYFLIKSFGPLKMSIQTISYVTLALLNLVVVIGNNEN